MTRQRATEPEGFSDFWDIWRPVCRESDGKPKARKTYAQHISAGANPRDIIDAARCHIRRRKEKGTLEYIQLASSWLNAERYEFEAEEERAYQARLQASQAQASENVVSMPRTVLPPNHFLNKWEEQKRREA